MLSFEELRSQVESGEVDTVVVAFTDMQGRLTGKRLHAEFFVEEVGAGHPVEGCNYLLALEMEMDPVPGYEIASWERGYGDFAHAARPGDPAPDPVARGDGARPLRRDLAGRLAGGALAPPGAARAARACGRGGVRADDRLRARVLPAQGELRRGAREALPRPDAVGAVHPRLPHPRDHLRRAAHPPDPERDAGGRDAGRDVEGRGLARAAGDQLPLRRRADDGRQPRDLQERRQGDRAPERLLDHLHGEARPHLDRELVPRPLVALARRRSGVRGRRDALRTVARGADRVLPRAGDLPRAERELVQALRGGLVGADDARLGATTTGPAGSGSWGMGRRGGWRRGSPAAT